jgi:hypothetical protein
MKFENDPRVTYDPISGVTINLDPGGYVLLHKADWERVREHFADGSPCKRPEGIEVLDFELPDPGPPTCDECGIGMWTHSSTCPKMERKYGAMGDDEEG